MPRAKSKDELLVAANKQYQALWTLINSLTEEELHKIFLFEDRDKNVRDVLIHLHEWHNMLLAWVHNNTSGHPQSFLPEGYNWKTYPKLNVVFWENHQNTSFDHAKAMFNKTHHDVITVIESFTNEELFTKKFFNWTGSTSLGSYCVSSTASHYDWAIKKIKKHQKLIREHQ